ncbi:hypothetical protein ACH5RR_001097 [Cinchona calisaya]|uniref:Uncharacterized protein n=1 Tax=Cinchona calisaya TaxID=153742 RepID=A0ABD3B2U9_9GENT
MIRQIVPCDEGFQGQVVRAVNQLNWETVNLFPMANISIVDLGPVGGDGNLGPKRDHEREGGVGKGGEYGGSGGAWKVNGWGFKVEFGGSKDGVDGSNRSGKWQGRARGGEDGEESGKIGVGADEIALITTFMSGIQQGMFNADLASSVPKTFKELLQKAVDYIQGEESNRAKRKLQEPREKAF